MGWNSFSDIKNPNRDVTRLASRQGFQGMLDFLMEVNQGNVPGHDLVHKFGLNNQITTVHHHIWNDPTVGGVDLVWQTVAAQYDVVSDDAGDDAAGLGARKVTLECLDASFNTVFETVDLDGLTPVTTTGGPYIRLQRAYIAAVGTYNGSNLGNIDITVTGGGDRQGYITLDEGQTQKTQYTVPAGYTAYLLRTSITIEATKTFALDLHVRPDADLITGDMGPTLSKHQWVGLTAPVEEHVTANHIFSGKTDIWFEALGTASGGAIEVDYDVLIVQDGF